MDTLKQQPVVLLVDDDEPIRDSASMLLEIADISCQTAIDGDAALAFLEAGMRPQIIVCDYRLPGMNGLDVVRHAREILGEDVPIIIMSGDTSGSTIEAANLAHCRLLRKPFTTDILIELVNKSLAN